MLNEVTPFAWLEFGPAAAAPAAGNTQFRRIENPTVYPRHGASAAMLHSATKHHTNNALVTPTTTAKTLYASMTADNELTRKTKRHAQQFLLQSLHAVQEMDDDLPGSVDAIASWIEYNSEQVGEQYREYLQSRKTGGPRRFFTTKSHALNFLRCVAPTKLVDGAWLYGFARQWDNPRVAALIRIYLEELGDGQPGKNHVALYKKLLSDMQCDQWQDLPDQYFIQGAIQLALGNNTEEFLPEAIGFNLGYEQLPLHLLITAYELNELGIDPYYFTLHVTVDNASSGHARQSLQALMDSVPKVGGRDEFFRRVADGYRLNQLGMGTTDIIAGFDLEQELIDILASKSVYGKNMHSDYCRIDGRTVNEWLSDKSQIPQFIESLVSNHWIVRHQDPEHSRFWKLLQSEKAEMFGVFNAYEMQVIYDWIAGDALSHDVKARHGKTQAASHNPAENSSGFPPRQLSYRMRQRQLAMDQNGHETDNERGTQAGNISGERRHAYHANDDHYQAADPDICRLQETMAALSEKEQIMHLLAGLMSPTMHHTPVGMLATRLYKSMLDREGQVFPDKTSAMTVA